MENVNPQSSWLTTLGKFTHPRVVTMLFLGFSAGIPILLIFSSLSLWLREAGVERAAVTYFSWAALGYSFKFVWAPLVDQLPLPWLSRVLGRRRAWMLVAQFAIIAAIVLMASIDPKASDYSLTLMALAAVLLGFSSATQDIVIDAYRIESAESELQALLSATYIAGYRIGMLVAGAGSLYLAASFGSTSDAYSYQAWQYTYWLMAAAMLVGIVTTLIIDEPETKAASPFIDSTREYIRFMALFVVVVAGFVGCFYLAGDAARSAKSLLTELFANRYLAGFLIECLRLAIAIGVGGALAFALVKVEFVSYEMVNRSYLMPVRDFFRRYGLSLAWMLLVLIGFYRISDIVLGVIANVFYQDLGFSKIEIALVSKTFGLLMTIVGGFAGGLLAMRFGVMRILFLGALLSAATNLLFMLLASVGHDMMWLYIVISADNISAGLASAAFIAFLSSLTNISFTATQYAIFSSLMTLLPKVIGGYSGSMVDSIGYPVFFLLTALMGIPVLLLIVYAARRYRW
ncbi:MAG: MFS transporter [Proteobacteria bacterium]|nr:MFS transporter [Pseudomonadota bacterium]MCH8177058.1 MFS transporter [Pseudomonadota bacterium]